jgi:predicted ATPase
MYLSKFRLLNYKSFQDSEVLEFKPGINIIVGPNNSGKTALLEALSLKFQNNIHKSITTFPSPSDVINTYSMYQLSLIVKKASIVSFINQSSASGNMFVITLPDEYTQNAYLSQPLQQFLDNESFQDIEIQIRSSSSDLIPFDSVPNFFSSSYNEPLENLLKKRGEDNRSYPGFYYPNQEPGSPLTSFGQTIQYQFFQKYRSIIYKFNAERVSSGISQVGLSSTLEANASNLAEVLSNLQLNNPSLYEIFNKYVSRVIPTIKWISAPLYNGINSQVKIWNLDRATQRGDLAYPLSDCGTGISQVLAILYVVISSQEPQIIIIDEPQSFLHPGAAKKLIEIFKEFSQHQYFIATHSAEIIAAANPSTIVKLRYEDGETQTSTMNAGDIREQRSLLAELGVSLSDVFGADRILWVEGPTEELCFPLILEKAAKMPLRGTKIIAVKNTGDFEGKRAHLVFDVYDKLSGGSSLFPPTIGFVFDRENKCERQRNDLKKRSQHPVEFLDRRMYENYLLHPDAIAAVLNQEDAGREQPLTSVEVREWLETNKSNKNYFPKISTQQDLSNPQTQQDISNPQWVDENIDAAKLLDALFSHFSEARVKFNKTKHSVMLTEWLLENNPDCFAELVKFLQRILAAGEETFS